ncbi:hypothetical protein NGI46_07560 [Peribacillus butanolivorans]|nr:hypothetical protein [Peribacillus butanolivorans]
MPKESVLLLRLDTKHSLIFLTVQLVVKRVKSINKIIVAPAPPTKTARFINLLE